MDENSLLKGLLPVAETEVVEEVEAVVLAVVVAVEAVVLDCCCICISVPRIILDRLGLEGPVRPPSVAAVDWVALELELVDDVVEDEVEAEVASSRDNKLASIWEVFPVLLEPIPAMDMVGSPF